MASVLALGAQWNTALDLFAHFRAQYLLCFAILGACALWLRALRLAATIFVFFFINAAVIAPLLVSEQIELSNPSDPVVIVTANVLHRGGDAERVSTLVGQTKPDVLALLEVDSEWPKHLSETLRTYPYRVEEPRENDFGIALYSRIPISSFEVLEFPPFFLPSIRASLEGGLDVIATHPCPPADGHSTLARNSQLNSLADLAAGSSSPVVLVGDLNTTPFSPSFSELLRRGDLHDSARGYGFTPTWPSYFPPLWIPIDHVLHTAGVKILDRRVGPDIGSDHYPIIVTLRYDRDG
ncbi:MAG: endonuclease/exonuclease/phosphatase family protein [Myxococcota bacterium]